MKEVKSIATVLPVGKFFDQVYQAVLAPWCAQQGAAFTRVDLTAGSAGPICNAVEAADLVIADVSGRNPRVMYCAGYAHGIGKRVLFITQLEEDFPFSGPAQKVIIYSGNLEFLKSELETFSFGGAEPKTDDDPREQFLAMFGEILRAHAHEHRGPVEMEKEGTFVLREQDMDLPLVQALSRRARELGVRLKLM